MLLLVRCIKIATHSPPNNQAPARALYQNRYPLTPKNFNNQAPARALYENRNPQTDRIQKMVKMRHPNRCSVFFSLGHTLSTQFLHMSLAIQ